MPLQCPPRLLISIHPPRKGRDRTAPKSFPPLEEFQSTLPARGGTASKNPQKPAEPTFQSTLPVWGGTVTALDGEFGITDFNPPSPCGEGHGITNVVAVLG